MRSPSWVKSSISWDFSLKSCHRLSNSFYLHKPSLNFSLPGKQVCPLLGNCLPPYTSINSFNVVGFLRALSYWCSWEKSFFVGKQNIWTFMFFFTFYLRLTLALTAFIESFSFQTVISKGCAFGNVTNLHFKEVMDGFVNTLKVSLQWKLSLQFHPQPFSSYEIFRDPFPSIKLV